MNADLKAGDKCVIVKYGSAGLSSEFVGREVTVVYVKSSGVYPIGSRMTDGSTLLCLYEEVKKITPKPKRNEL